MNLMNDSKCITPITVGQLREEIRRQLLEMDTGAAGYGADIGPLTGGYGFMNYGGSLKNIFVDPFLDVIKTTKGVATELTARAKSAAQVAIEVVLSSFIPLYQTNYSNIFSQMNKNLDEIKKKYEKVYQANDEAFQDKDARFLAFLYDPSAWVSAKTVESAPAVVADVLQVFTDSSSGAGSQLMEAIRYLRELQMELQGTSRYNRSVPHRLRRQASSHKDMLPWESKERVSKPILEAEQAAEMTTAQKIEKILSNPQLKKEIDSSKLAQEMKADGKKVLHGLFANLSKDISDVGRINSLEDVEKMSGGRVKVPDSKEMTPEETQQANAAAVGNIKKSLSEFYKRSLQGAIKQAESEGVGSNNSYVRTLQGLLQKVGT